MPFDIEGARKAGYSDTEIADYLGKENKFDTSGALKAGYGPLEIINHLTLAPGNAGRGTDTSQAVTRQPPVFHRRGFARWLAGLRTGRSCSRRSGGLGSG